MTGGCDCATVISMAAGFAPTPVGLKPVTLDYSDLASSHSLDQWPPPVPVSIPHPQPSQLLHRMDSPTRLLQHTDMDIPHPETAGARSSSRPPSGRPRPPVQSGHHRGYDTASCCDVPRGGPRGRGSRVRCRLFQPRGDGCPSESRSGDSDHCPGEPLHQQKTHAACPQTCGLSRSLERVRVPRHKYLAVKHSWKRLHLTNERSLCRCFAVLLGMSGMSRSIWQ